MAGKKLKAALAAHQSQLAHKARLQRAEEAQKAKQRSISGPAKTRKSASSNSTGSAGQSGGKKKKAIVPFDTRDTILLLGEGNFSFAASLVLPPHNHPGRLILATSYDAEGTLYDKYADARANVERLRAAGARVEFGVDAGDLDKCKAVGKGRWSKVIFNFPHAGELPLDRCSPVGGKLSAGAGINDQDRNILSNQHLLLRTLRSVSSVLTSGPSSTRIIPKKNRAGSDSDSDHEVDADEPEGVSDIEEEDSGEPSHTLPPSSRTFVVPEREGTLLVTLLDQPPYTLWALPSLAKRPPPLCPGTQLPQPRYKVVRSFEFDPGLYKGYEHRRTIGWKDGVSRGGNEEIVGRKGKARTWEFARVNRIVGDRHDDD